MTKPNIECLSDAAASQASNTSFEEDNLAAIALVIQKAEKKKSEIIDIPDRYYARHQLINLQMYNKYQKALIKVLSTSTEEQKNTILQAEVQVSNDYWIATANLQHIMDIESRAVV